LKVKVWGTTIIPLYPTLLREMCRIDGINPAANSYVNRYLLRMNRDQMHMAFFMVDHDKIDPSKYKDVFNLPKTWQEAWNIEIHG
jgi:hypothetical protein